MKWLQDILSQEVIHALGWTLIHSIWQGSLIALALGVLFWFLHRQSAQVRYVAALAAMLLMLMISSGTFIYLMEKQAGSVTMEPEIVALPMLSNVWVSEPSFSETQNLSSVTATSPGLWAEITAYFHTHLPLIVVLWLMGVLVFLLKLIGGIAYVQRLKNYKTKPVDEKWKNKLQLIANRLGVSQSVQLMESALVKTPMVIGHLKPVILLPMGILTGIPAAQIEVILAHELAHISRHDYLINILQKLVELLFFYHPAVWWISALMRTEREHCCDDLAISVSGDSLTFAKALASIQELGIGNPMIAMAFVGKKKRILSRVNRLLKGSHFQFSVTEGIVMTCVIIFGVFLIQLNANAKFEPHEAVEFIAGGIENNLLINDENFTNESKADIIIEELVEKQDTTIRPAKVVSIPAMDSEDAISIVSSTTDSIRPTISIISNGKTFQIGAADTYTPHIVQLDSLLQSVVAVTPNLSLASTFTDSIIRNKIQISTDIANKMAFGNAFNTMAFNVDFPGNYVPITERFHNVTGTFTIKYDEEGRKYKTISLTTENGKVTNLEVNGEKINAIAIDAMINEIDREGREFARSQWRQQMEEQGHMLWDFKGDTLQWKNNGVFEYGEDWDTHLQDQLRLQEEQMEKIQRIQEEALEHQEQQRQMINEQVRDHAERVQEHRSRIQEHKEEHEQQNKVIIDELYRDKLIDNKDKVKLEITKAKMTVNGKKQSDKMLKKYINLIEDVKDIEIGDDSTFTMSYTDDDVNIKKEYDKW